MASVSMEKLNTTVFTVRELCAYLKIGRNTAYDLVHSGQLKCVWVKSQIRIPECYVAEYLHNASEQKPR